MESISNPLLEIPDLVVGRQSTTGALLAPERCAFEAASESAQKFELLQNVPPACMSVCGCLHMYSTHYHAASCLCLQAVVDFAREHNLVTIIDST